MAKKNQKEAETDLASLKKQYVELKMSKSVTLLSKPHRLKALKKEIARKVMTGK